MDHVYISDWAVQIPFWVVVPLLFLLGWASWKVVMWVIALLR